MLKGVHPLVGPDLLAVLSRMGHGDELVLADAHFPGESIARRCLRCDGIGIADLLDAFMPLFELDSYADPLCMMAPVAGDSLDPGVESRYLAAVRRHAPSAPTPVRVDRQAFYDRSKQAFAVVMTGETAKYGNLIVKKGVIPTSE